jgi:hypothetical protein
MELRPHLPAVTRWLAVQWLVCFGALACAARPGTVRTTAGATLQGQLTFGTNAVIVISERSVPVQVPLEEWLEVTLEAPDKPPAPDPSETHAAAASETADGWSTVQIGTGAPGTMTVNSDGWTLNGSGTGLRSNADNAFLAQRPLDLSGQVLAQLEAFDGSEPDAMTGLTLRDNLGEAAAYAFIGRGPGATLCFQYRQIAGGMTMRVTNVNHSLPVWLRLSRTGGAVVAEVSPDGRQWNALGRANVNLGRSVRAGMLVASGSPDTLAMARFRYPAVGARGLGYIPASGYPRLELRGGSVLVAPVEAADESVLHLGGALDGSIVSVLNLARLEFVPLTPELEGRLESGRTGVLLVDGDSLNGTLRGIVTNHVIISSLLFGFRQFTAGSEAAAVQLAPSEPEEAPYEVRLLNGSMIRARYLETAPGALQARSALLGSLRIDAEEIRQIRRLDLPVQSLRPDEKDEEEPPAPGAS